MNRAENLKRAAERIGFDRVGVAALTSATTGRWFLEWLAEGAQAGMAYLERRVEKRLDPREVLPGARSAVCVALRYWPLSESSDSGDENDLWSGVARYARGRDYHDIMLEGLEELEVEIADNFPGARTRRYVDTGPILERDLASKAGLGVFGKNCNLLDPRMGSYFLLGEVLTTVDLEPDTPIADLCGTCAECLEACPTGALTGPYRLDSRLCISYWTIEHRGAIPEPMRGQVGEWVFGCDICQEVCPANVDISPARHPQLELPETRRELSLTDLLRLDREDYVDKFRGSPMKRAKLEGLKRNVVVAMGNRGSSQYLEPLSVALGDRDSVVRGHSAWALARLELTETRDTESRRATLDDALRRETDVDVRAEIEAALEMLASES
jgi:epoxyqueuosine reductase